MSRTLAGFVASHFGWRAMLWLAVPLVLSATIWMALKLPRSYPENRLSYPRLIWSLVGLWREFAELRRGAATQALLFSAFASFWTMLAFRLQEARFGLGADIAGLFGLVGALGILAAPVAGRVADKHGPTRVVILAAVLAVLSWLILGAWDSILGMIVGAFLLDFAVQAALVANLHITYSLRPSAQARLNTLFVGTMFIGAALGSAVGTKAYFEWGWNGVVVTGVALCGAALALQLPLVSRGHRRGG